MRNCSNCDIVFAVAQDGQEITVWIMHSSCHPASLSGQLTPWEEIFFHSKGLFSLCSQKLFSCICYLPVASLNHKSDDCQNPSFYSGGQWWAATIPLGGWCLCLGFFCCYGVVLVCECVSGGFLGVCGLLLFLIAISDTKQSQETFWVLTISLSFPVLLLCVIPWWTNLQKIHIPMAV